MEIEPDELSKTPQELINMLKIEHMSFENPQNSYQSLTQFVNQITKSIDVQCQLIVLVYTGKIKYIGADLVAIFVEKVPKPIVHAILHLCVKYTFSDAFWYHYHEINSETFDAHFCTLTTDQLNKVQDQQKMGVTQGQIRANLGINMNSSNFYHYCHNKILKLKNDH